MKILFIAPRYHTNQFAFVQKLISEGHIVKFFAIGIGNTEDHDLIMPEIIPCYCKSNNNISENASNEYPQIIKYYKMICSFNPDIIIVRGASNPIYSKLLFPLKIIKKFRIIYYTQGAKYVKKISLLRKIHDIICVRLLNISWFTPVLYYGTYNYNLIENKNITYLPFFVYSKVNKSKTAPNDSTIKFLCISKYEPRKNIMALIDAIKEITDDNIYNLELTIVGSTGTIEREEYYQKINKYINQLGIDKYVHTLKNIPYKQMNVHFNNNHVFVLPSKNEPASISQIEAMTYGLPVICSNDNGTSHYVNDNRNGYIIEPNVSEIKLHILKYINDPSLIEKHSKESLYLIDNEYNINNTYRRFIEITKK